MEWHISSTVKRTFFVILIKVASKWKTTLISLLVQNNFLQEKSFQILFKSAERMQGISLCLSTEKYFVISALKSKYYS